jgi:hypothetical protein
MALMQSDYVLGHTPTEQLRLIRQARILAPATERFLGDAGITPGMRVLDIGCGMGDVSCSSRNSSVRQARSYPSISIWPPLRPPASTRRLLGR